MRLPGVPAYVGAVSVGGALMLAVGQLSGFGAVRSYPAQTVLFILLTVLAEMLPIRMVRGTEPFELNVSLTFSFALLLRMGPAPALLVAGIAAFAADAARRKPIWRSLFNGLQGVLALGAAAVVLELIMPPGPAQFTNLGHLVPLVIAGLVLFVVNHAAVSGALALHQGLPVTSLLGGDALLHVTSTVVMVSLSPVLLLAADQNFLYVFVVLLPLGALYLAARGMADREFRAHRDPLTGLENRARFRELAAATVREAARERRRLAVLLIDVDRFKEVNDTLGHGVGDELLAQIGPRLHASLGEGDHLARLGGDEFAILLAGATDATIALERAAQVGESLEQPFGLSGLSLDIEASIGIALFPDHGRDVDTLIQKADVAMYQAKDSRAGCELYSPERDPYSAERLTVLGELRRALESEQCVLHYQPKALVATGEIIGVEVLVRWAHPARGLLLPDAFVPLAERTGLSRTLTLYVLERGLRQCRRWHDLGLPLQVAVNLSVRNLHDAAFPEDVRRLMEETNVDASCLQLEITEGTVMADPQRVMRVLLTLRSMGIELCLDDFGTGYSSLTYLKRLPVAEIKIDKSFVTGMDRDPNDAAIVRSTIELGRNLGKRVVAEGVEHKEVWDQLLELGCEVAQGYFLGRPVPADELTEMLLRQEAGQPGVGGPGVVAV